MKEIRRKTMEFAGHEPVDYVTKQITDIPSTTFLWAALATIAGSFFLLMFGRKWESMFVGLWAPTIMSLGLIAKLLGVTPHERY